jgi:predicted P-loop ATPase
LVGTKQGEGKSTFIKWLAINEQWFTEIKKVDGSDSIEQLFGAWVCEIPELSAFKKAGDVESIKAYITRTKDKYRKPYDKSPVEYPRRCLFIGTTNSDRFLTDKSGNRRFYPVTVRSSGYDLFDHEKECKDYIIQCWAEARERFKAGNMPPFADYHLIKEYQKMQDEAMEDDWRVGKIASYLEHFVPGAKICAIQIYKECLYPESSAGPKPYESREIGQIIGKIDGWEKLPSRYYAEKYGQQRGWIKNENAKVSNADELPF